MRGLNPHWITVQLTNVSNLNIPDEMALHGLFSSLAGAAVGRGNVINKSGDTEQGKWITIQTSTAKFSLLLQHRPHNIKRVNSSYNSRGDCYMFGSVAFY